MLYCVYVQTASKANFHNIQQQPVITFGIYHCLSAHMLQVHFHKKVLQDILRKSYVFSLIISNLCPIILCAVNQGQTILGN